MRIFFITQDDPFFIKIFFDRFFEVRPEGVEIVGAAVARTMGESKRALLKRLYDFYGPVDLVRMLSRYGVRQLLAQTVGRISRRHPVTLEQVFRSHGVPVVRPTNVNGKKFRGWLSEQQPDLLVSVAAPQIFKKRLLAIPRIACINVHTARLPKYRGMLPNFWVLYHGDPTSAVTVHTMDEKIDRGRMLVQREFPIEADESLDQLIRRTKRLGAECVAETIERIGREGLVPIDPPEVEPSYFSFPTREHARELRARGRRLL